MGHIRSLAKNILIFSYVLLFSSSQLLGWSVNVGGRELGPDSGDNPTVNVLGREIGHGPENKPSINVLGREVGPGADKPSIHVGGHEFGPGAWHQNQPQQSNKATRVGRSQTIRLKPGYYKIKNVETGKYITQMDGNIDQDVYPKWNIFSLRMLNKANKPNQVFKITEKNGWHSITNVTFGPAIMDTGKGTTYFYKSLQSGIYRKIKITGQGGVLGYSITSEKDQNSRYGVKGDKLVRDANNSRFIFEPKSLSPRPPDPRPPSPRPIPRHNKEIEYLKNKINVQAQIISDMQQQIANIQQQMQHQPQR